MKISFIIPAFNEQKCIGNTIQSIRDIENISDFEIIVVDHSSSDETKRVAEQKGANVITLDKTHNIGSLRNQGARTSTGNILVFLDADVTLTSKWWNEFENIKHQIVSTDIITGSRLFPPENNTRWITRMWYNDSVIEHEQAKYINSGHLIISRDLFERLGGFSSTLITGEDSDLSERAKKQFNAHISNNLKLKAIHHGYPQTVTQFFNRERWHGRGNFQHLEKLSSKMSLFILCSISSLLISIIGMIITPWSVMLYFIVTGGQSCFLALRRYGKIDLNIPLYVFLSWVGITARSVSVLDVLKLKLKH